MLWAQDDLAPNSYTHLINTEPCATVRIPLDPHHESIAQEIKNLRRVSIINGCVGLLIAHMVYCII